MTPEERFWSKVQRDTTTGCLRWTAAKTQGYGRFSVEGRLVNAHAFAWEAEMGPVPEGMVLDHQCHNLDHSCLGGDDCPHRSCVNVDHLRIVTQGENVQAYYDRRTHCPKGHEYTPESMMGGRRQCRVCHNARTAAAKIAQRTHCPQGHEYTEGNTIVTRNGRRMCRSCVMKKVAAMNAAKRPTGARVLDAVE